MDQKVEFHSYRGTESLREYATREVLILIQSVSPDFPGHTGSSRVVYNHTTYRL